MIHSFYLKHGNLKEILGMGYWRFVAIAKVAHKIHQIESGKPFIEEDGKLPESVKDMIEKRKAQR
jgi:hypothetical protein